MLIERWLFRPAINACVVGALSSLACKIDRDVIAGEYIDYEFSPDLQPCGGSASYTDDFAPFLISLLNVQGFTHATFSWVDADEFGSGLLRSCSGNIGCTPKNQAYSQWPIHIHEVVHAVMYFVNHRPLPFLQEGIAVALDMPSGLTLEVLQASGLQAVDPRTELMKETNLDYGKVGLFTLYLLQVHGINNFMTLYDRSELGADEAEINALFEDIYDLSINELVDLYLGGQGCPQVVDQFPWYDCEAAELMETEQGGWLMERVVDCMDSDVFGGVASDFGIHVAATFEVEVPGIYQVRFDGPNPALAHVGQCGGCRWLAPQLIVSPEQTETQYLYKGTHFVAMRIFEGGRGDASVSIVPFP